jgi:hypothetical protein
LTTLRNENDSQNLPDTVLLDDVILKLEDIGLSSDLISFAIDVPKSKVHSVLTSVRRRPAPEEEKLIEEMRRLAHLAIKEAFKILTYGPTEQRLSIIKSMLAPASKLIGSEGQGSTMEARLAFETMLSQLSNVPARKTIVTETDILDVAIDAPIESIDDQDDEAWVPET